MKEVHFLGKEYLIDSEGIRYKRKEPVLKLKCEMTSRNSKIRPKNFEQKIFDLQKKGELKKGVYAANAFVIVKRKPINQKVIISRSWGPTKYKLLEICDIELHKLNE